MISAYAANDAAAYEHSMGRWSRALAEVFVQTCALPAAGAMLDAGCGTGALAEAILARDPTARITGIDISDAFVAAARARVPAADFQTGDVTALPFGPEKFDAALSLLVLAFVPDPALAVAELARVTRPGGLVAAAMWDFRSFPFLRLFADTAAALLPAAEAWRAKHWGHGIGAPGSLAPLFEAAGLIDVTEHDLCLRQDFRKFEDWFGPWRGGQGIVGAFLVGLPAADQALLEQAARRAYCAGAVDGPRSFLAVARCAVGRVSDE